MLRINREKSFNSSSWSSVSIAWMVDRDGNAIGVDNHMQSGDVGENAVDEWAITTAYKYGLKTSQNEYCKAAKILAYWDITSAITLMDAWDDFSGKDVWDWKAQIDESLVDTENKKFFLEMLGLSTFKETVNDAYGRLLDLGLDPEDGRNSPVLKEAIQTLSLLFNRLMMRVRAGGLTNSLVTGAKELYFRIPDTNISAWRRAICNFIWDNPEYSSYECLVYSDINGIKTPLESYTDCKEFVDLHSSRRPTGFKMQKFNSCYKHGAYYYELFKDKLSKMSK